MKPRDWKEIAELIGIGAIVASLVFVGVQLKQEQQIALTEIYEAATSSATELDIAISENADIWVKANSGETLSESELLIIRRLVAASYRRARGQANMRRIVGTHGTAAIRDFAIMLYENPGVHEVWEVQINNEIDYFAKMAPDDDFRRGYRDEVLTELEKLAAGDD